MTARLRADGVLSSGAVTKVTAQKTNDWNMARSARIAIEYDGNANQQAPLIVCCYHGNSSQGAAAYLASIGFAETYSLDGGFDLWRQTYPERVSAD